MVFGLTSESPSTGFEGADLICIAQRKSFESKVRIAASRPKKWKVRIGIDGAKFLEGLDLTMWTRSGIPNDLFISQLLSSFFRFFGSFFWRANWDRIEKKSATNWEEVFENWDLASARDQPCWEYQNPTCSKDCENPEGQYRHKVSQWLFLSPRNYQ